MECCITLSSGVAKDIGIEWSHSWQHACNKVDKLRHVSESPSIVLGRGSIPRRVWLTPPKENPYNSITQTASYNYIVCTLRYWPKTCTHNVYCITHMRLSLTLDPHSPCIIKYVITELKVKTVVYDIVEANCYVEYKVCLVTVCVQLIKVLVAETSCNGQWLFPAMFQLESSPSLQFCMRQIVPNYVSTYECCSDWYSGTSL